MKKLRNFFKPLTIFYILMGYIIASFIWWTFLHLENINQAYKDQLEIAKLKHESQGLNKEEIDIQSMSKDLAEKEWRKNTRMILGEASIFILIYFVRFMDV